MLEWRMPTAWCPSGVGLWYNGVVQAWVSRVGGTYYAVIKRPHGLNTRIPTHSPEAAKQIIMARLISVRRSEVEALLDELEAYRKESDRLLLSGLMPQTPQQP